MYKRPSHTSNNRSTTHNRNFSNNHNPYMQKRRAQKKECFTVVDGNSSNRKSVHFFLCFLLVLFVLSVLGMQYISMQSSQARASLNSADNNDIVDANDTIDSSSNDSSSNNSSSNDATNEQSVISNNSEKIYPIGESYQDSYCSATLLSCYEYTQYYTAFAPADGNKIIVALFQFKNLSDSELPVQFQDFSCYADKIPCEPYYTISTQGIYFYSVLAPNEECTGAIAFEVPASATTIQFQYLPSYVSDQSVLFEDD